MTTIGTKREFEIEKKNEIIELIFGGKLNANKI